MTKILNMKSFVCSICLTAPAVLCVAQSRVLFANDPSFFINDPVADRFVRCVEGGGKLSGDNWAAQLWYAIGSTDPTTVADPVAHFFASGAGPAGVWQSGFRDLPGTTPG